MAQTTRTKTNDEQANAVRSFAKLNFSDAELTELRLRINATKWPERETVRAKGFSNVRGVSIPVAVSVFPDELYPAPRSWTERAYPN